MKEIIRTNKDYKTAVKLQTIKNVRRWLNKGVNRIMVSDEKIQSVNEGEERKRIAKSKIYLPPLNEAKKEEIKIAIKKEMKELMKEALREVIREAEISKKKVSYDNEETTVDETVFEDENESIERNFHVHEVRLDNEEVVSPMIDRRFTSPMRDKNVSSSPMRNKKFISSSMRNRQLFPSTSTRDRNPSSCSITTQTLSENGDDDVWKAMMKFEGNLEKKLKSLRPLVNDEIISSIDSDDGLSDELRKAEEFFPKSNFMKEIFDDKNISKKKYVLDGGAVTRDYLASESLLWIHDGVRRR